MVRGISRRRFLGTAAAGAAALAAPGVALSQAKTPVKIGMIVTLSGPIVQFGQQQKLGAEVGADLINRAGGIDGRPLELIIRDDKFTPTEAVAQVRDLLGQGVNLFMGGVFTPIALAVSGLMPDAKGIYISTAAIGDSLTHEAFNNHYFRVSDSAIMRYTAEAEAAAQRNPGVKRWGAVIPDLEGLGLSPWRAFKAGMERAYPAHNKGAKPEFVDPVFFKVSATDFKTQISAALALPVDGLFISANSPTFWQQAKLLGLDDKFKVLVDAGNGTNVARVLGKNGPTVWQSDHWNWHAWVDKNAMAKQFYDELVKKSGGDTEPSGFVEPPYSALLAYAKAIKATHSTEADTLIKALEGMSFDTVQGSMTFRKEDHQSLQAVDIFKVGPADNKLGFAVTDSTPVDASKLAEPATPGKPIVYPGAGG